MRKCRTGKLSKKVEIHSYIRIGVYLTIIWIVGLMMYEDMESKTTQFDNFLVDLSKDEREIDPKRRMTKN